MAVASEKKWFPLESNPDVINSYVSKMGLDTSKACFVDVLSSEDWALEMVPQPIYALLMLYPVKESSETHLAAEEERINTSGQILSSSAFFTKQTVGNACGTIAILHAIGNSLRNLDIQSESYLDTFFSTTHGMSPDEIAAYLEGDVALEECHEDAAASGQSEQIADIDDDVNTHFICFSCVEGHIYEFDGRKSFPINHGECSPEQLLHKAVDCVRQFMERDPEEVRFTMVALTTAPETDDS